MVFENENALKFCKKIGHKSSIQEKDPDFTLKKASGGILRLPLVKRDRVWLLPRKKH